MNSVSGGNNNWWTWNLEVKPFPEESVFRVDLCPTEPVRQMSFQDAADYTAELIAQKFKNLHVAMGGGLDSEFVATVLLRNNIPFVPVVGYIKNSKNVDFHYALEWCHQHSLTPKLIEFELDDPRLVKQAMAVASTYHLERSRLYIALAIIDYISSVGGHALTGDPSIGYTDTDENFYNGIGDTFEIWPVELMPTAFNPSHPGAFFFYTPELVLAQATELDTTLNDSRSRSKLYQIPFKPKTWPPLALSDSTRLKIKQQFNIHKYSNPKHYSWAKQDLIRLLNSNC